jgi:DNA invertase Pin-like site-specific DNA recombinase
MAELERDLISERVSSGYKRWRAERPKGHWGRRAIQLKEPLPVGISLREAAKLLGVSKTTIQRRRLNMTHSSQATTQTTYKEGL